MCPDVFLELPGHAEVVTINGLPLHPIIVHATVIGLPALGVLALLYVAKPDLQDKLRLWLMGLALGAAALVFLTVRSGTDLQSSRGLPPSFVHVHHVWATRLEWTTFGFAALVVLIGFVDQRASWTKPLLHALLVVAALAVAFLTYKTGEAGARMIYG